MTVKAVPKHRVANRDRLRISGFAITSDEREPSTGSADGHGRRLVVLLRPWTGNESTFLRDGR